MSRRFVEPYHVFLLLSILAIFGGIYFGYPQTPSSTKSFPVSFYDARWSDFSWIICEAGLSKWQDMGYRLGYDWHSLQVIRESGQGSKDHCQSLLAKYFEKNGDSKAMRERVVKACDDVHIGGRLKDIVKGKGYSI